MVKASLFFTSPNPRYPPIAFRFFLHWFLYTEVVSCQHTVPTVFVVPPFFLSFTVLHTRPLISFWFRFSALPRGFFYVFSGHTCLLILDTFPFCFLSLPFFSFPRSKTTTTRAPDWDPFFFGCVGSAFSPRPLGYHRALHPATKPPLRPGLWPCRFFFHG